MLEREEPEDTTVFVDETEALVSGRKENDQVDDSQYLTTLEDLFILFRLLWALLIARCKWQETKLKKRKKN